MRLIIPMILFVVAVVQVLGEPDLLSRPLAHLGPVVKLDRPTAEEDDAGDCPIVVAALHAGE